MEALTLEQRWDWFINNEPKDFIPTWDRTWKQTASEIKNDYYMYCFNHPFYCGPIIKESDELRHDFLDEMGVPKIL